jgi:hypothetical protein
MSAFLVSHIASHLQHAKGACWMESGGESVSNVYHDDVNSLEIS